MAENIVALIEDTKVSYYEYVVKIEDGCTRIVAALKADQLAEGLRGIVDLSEGLSWLIEAETLLKGQSLHINSPISSVVPLFEKINVAIEATNYNEVISLIEDELKPLFKNAADWQFEEVIS
ncbi:hypothetical protein [Caryophanon latum]|uniref:Uncharacterized protein n=1 Tax=Caryophanon latum TaxID=33977 RepID=A0A1C0YR27_9BACL|nr:hypothetical protein [Caryophanon latum]OCS89634.1 hypothetical protein A6K76_12355 [Caryophanon latum]